MAMREITPVGRPIGRIRPGQVLRVSAAHAAALVAAGLARYPVHRVVVPVEPPATEDPDHGTEPEVRISPRTGRPIRQYKRRDVRAED